MNATVIPLVGIPQFELTIGNSAISPQLKSDIENIQMKEDVKTPAMLSFSVNLWDSKLNKLKEEYITQFALGTPLELSIGINETSAIFTGEVTALEPQFGGIEGGDRLEVRAYNSLKRLQYGTKQRTFNENTSSEIASQIASDFGLTAEVEDSADKKKHVTQKGETDYQFLLNLAKNINYEVLVEDKTLYFRKPQESEGAVLSLTYRFDLTDFNITQRVVSAGSKVEVRGWDVKNKKLILGKAEPGDEETKIGGSKSGAEISADAFTPTTRTYTHQSVADENEATQIAKAFFNQQQENFIEAQGKSAGSPLIRAGKTIEILGVGDTFSGLYYIKSVTHQIGRNAYTTNFTVRRNAL